MRLGKTRVGMLLLLLLAVFPAGCGGSNVGGEYQAGEYKAPSSEQAGVVQQPGQEQEQGVVPEGAQEESFVLNVSVRSSRSAVFVIDGIERAVANVQAVVADFDPDILDSLNAQVNIGMQWQVYFAPYMLIVRFDDLQVQARPHSVLLKTPEGESTHIGSPEVVREGDQLFITIQMEEGELDLFEIDNYELMYYYGTNFAGGTDTLDEEAHQALMNHLGGTRFFQTYSLGEMTRILPEAVFPAEVYDMGVLEGPGDATHFQSETGDYVIVIKPREFDTTISDTWLLEFDAAGYISKAVWRYENPGADEEMMKSNVATHEQDYYVAAAAHAGQFVYLTYTDEYLHSFNYPVSNQLEAVSTKELLLRNKILPTTSGKNLIEATDPVFISNLQLTETQRSMPVYCEPEDFFLLSYRSAAPPSENYVISEYRSGEEIHATIQYFDGQGNALVVEELAYSTGRKIYPSVHQENADVTYRIGNGSEPKKNGMTPMARTGYYLERNYRSYQDAIDAGSWAVYYSNPVLFD